MFSSDDDSFVFDKVLRVDVKQTYLQCLTNKDITDMKERRDKVKEIRNNLIKWKPFGQLPEDLRAQAIWCEDPKWLQNKDIDLKGILSNISPNLSSQIKGELCLPLLLKVSSIVRTK